MRDHLVSLTHGWSIWKWMRLRGAGFPAVGVLQLVAPAAVAGLERVLAGEADQQSARSSAIAALEARIHERSGEARLQVVRALRKLREGKVPDWSEDLAGAEIRALAAAKAATAAAREAYELAFAADDRCMAESLRSIASDARFREAVLWQNRAAFHRSVESLRREGGATNEKIRARQHLVASYWQRYCVKNETVGFFGPQGLAMVDARDDTVIDVEPGPGLVKKRTVYFEHWAIEALAMRLSEDAELKRELAPRIRPTIRVQGTTLYYPVARQVEIPSDVAQVLAACDGVRSAREIALTLVGVLEEVEVYELLDELEQRHTIIWSLEIPTATAHPEAVLTTLLGRLEPAIGQHRSAVSELLSARDRVAAAAGDPQALDAALGALEMDFTRLTERQAFRKGGEIYAGRTLVYEECLRDMRFVVGPQFLRRFAGPLALVLASARWITYEIGMAYRKALEDAYDQVVGQTGAPVVDYLRFWEAARALFSSGREPSAIVSRALAELQRRWVEVLGVDIAEKRIRRSLAEVEQACRTMFAAGHPGWPAARYHSPDLLVAASDVDAVKRGECTIVLGEVHAALNTCGLPTFQNQLDDAIPLVRARELDLPGPSIAPVVSKEHATSKDHVWQSRHAIDLEIGDTISWRPRPQVLGVGELVLERIDNSVIVRDRAGAHRYHLLEFFDTHLTAEISARFSLLPSLPHVPRIAIDNVVISRECWSFPTEGLAFASVRRGASQFAQCRRWVQEHGLPRWVFAKIPEERKPVFLDFESPIFVEILAKLVRRASHVQFSEMLPRVDECWLPDANGAKYACEIRMVAVDPERWRAEGT